MIKQRLEQQQSRLIQTQASLYRLQCQIEQLKEQETALTAMIETLKQQIAEEKEEEKC